MLGSVSEAEDAVQDALLRLHHTSKRVSGSSRHGRTLDRGHPPRDRRAAFRSGPARDLLGEWLPEPLVTARGGDPAKGAELADSLSLAFLVVLESLSPEQRAAFLLHEVFDYPYDRIAEIIGKSEDNVRQLTARARRHVEERRPRYEPSRSSATSWRGASSPPPATGSSRSSSRCWPRTWSCTGTAAAASRRSRGPCRAHARGEGARRLGSHRRPRRVRFRPVEVNGQPGALTLDSEGRIIGVLALEIVDGRIQSISSVVNPDKLRHVGPLGDVRAFLHGAALVCRSLPGPCRPSPSAPATGPRARA